MPKAQLLIPLPHISLSKCYLHTPSCSGQMPQNHPWLPVSFITPIQSISKPCWLTSELPEFCHFSTTPPLLVPWNEPAWSLLGLLKQPLNCFSFFYFSPFYLISAQSPVCSLRAARTILLNFRSDHVTFVFWNLQWLPVTRIEVRGMTVTDKACTIWCLDAGLASPLMLSPQSAVGVLAFLLLLGTYPSNSSFGDFALVSFVWSIFPQIFKYLTPTSLWFLLPNQKCLPWYQI